MPVVKRDEIDLPETQRDRMLAMRDAQLRKLDDALDMVPAQVEVDARRAIDRIVKSGYSDKVVKREIKRLNAGYFRNVRTTLSELIADILAIEGRYHKSRLAWELGERKRLSGELVSGSEAAFALGTTTNAVRTELAARLVTARQYKPWTPKTDAEKELAKHLRPWKSSRLLSKRLHKAQRSALNEANKLALRAVRDGRTMTATNDLIVAMHKRGVVLADADDLPGYLKKFIEAGNRLNKAGKSEAALREWRKERSRIRRYMSRLADGGRVQNALLETLQRTSADSAKGMKRALDVVINQRQQYVAERILETEAHSAMRSAQYIRDKDNPYIIGYRWHLSTGSRRDFVKRTPPNRLLPIAPKIPVKLGGRKRKRRRGRGRCLCEGMAERIVGVDYLSSHPHGGHPFCRCWFEPVYSRKALENAPMTADEEALYQSLRG